MCFPILMNTRASRLAHRVSSIHQNQTRAFIHATLVPRYWPPLLAGLRPGGAIWASLGAPHHRCAHCAGVVRVRRPLRKTRGCTATGTCERSFHLAMDAEWHLLCVLGVLLILPWHVFFVGSQGALEGLGAAKSEAFLLVSSTRSHLDDQS